MHIQLKNRVSDLDRIINLVDEFSGAYSLAPDLSHKIVLCLEELFSNIVFYGHEDGEEHLIELDLSRDEQKIIIEIADDGTPFDPLSAREPDLNVPLEDREIGGLGIFLVKSIMDSIEYRRADGKNILRMEKAFPSA